AEPATAPAAVSEITVEATHESATVKWKAPHDGGSAITGYTVSLGGATQVAPISTEGELSVKFEGLESKTDYTATVTAHNAVGTAPASEAAAFTTAPTPATVPGAPGNVSIE
ncbi:fibronectin type III domain-containing protein, partial [Paeniglutamicibacter sp. ORCA_105]|uniref:fibronectin type III domain-containing protein n=1 Tax=Paeniglutamicibacter sp. ORCA_105 TaxID=3377336 RepID=UPI003895809D